MIRMLDHTADVGFELSAPTLEGLFDEARRGLVRIMLERPPGEGEDRGRVDLAAPDLETLLVRWINELSFLVQGKEFVPTEAEVQVRDEGGRYALEAEFSGVPLDLEEHGWQGEVKSATFHGLRVEHREEGWQATVILDV
jgi:SHS2 domain-containing protein